MLKLIELLFFLFALLAIGSIVHAAFGPLGLVLSIVAVALLAIYGPMPPKR